MDCSTFAGVIASGFFQFLFTALAALGACAAAIFTFSASRATANASRGQTLLACLDKYISIMRDKREATEKQSLSLAKQFYRELFDLHWSEFHLWRQGAIPDNVMRAWLIVRKRNYDSDGITYIFASMPEQRISYANCWAEFTSNNYFEMADPFVKFMNKAHSGDISDLKKLKRNP